jgi:tripartite-type tricarboxylate transporter receptor subunit TctC
MPDYEVIVWYGLAGPKGLPRAIVDRINSEVTMALKSREAAEQLQNDGLSLAGGTPEQFLARIKKEIEVWRKVVNDTGVKIE